VSCCIARVRRSRRADGLDEMQVVQAVALYESGWLLREIATRFGVSRDTVRRRLAELGVVRRSGRQPRTRLGSPAWS
jgi:transposase